MAAVETDTKLDTDTMAAVETDTKLDTDTDIDTNVPIPIPKVVRATKPKVLLLLDMNGTLCYRGRSRLKAAGGAVREDLKYGKHYWYGRRPLGKFLRDITADDYYHVCVYTSMMAHNARASVDAIVGHDERHLISGVFDRKYNKPDPIPGARKWDTVRDLTKIWQDTMYTMYDHTNTILVDNEARKFKDTPRNGIVVPEFGAQEVISGTDDGLEQLGAYLVQLASDGPADVREYMEARPFTYIAKKKHGVGGALDAVTARMSAMHVHGVNGELDALLNLPQGTTVHLEHIEGTYAVMKTENGVKSFKVKCTEGVRIETKMNLRKLIAAVGADSIVLDREE